MASPRDDVQPHLTTSRRLRLFLSFQCSVRTPFPIYFKMELELSSRPISKARSVLGWQLPRNLTTCRRPKRSGGSLAKRTVRVDSESARVVSKHLGRGYCGLHSSSEGLPYLCRAALTHSSRQDPFRPRMDSLLHIRQ
jgi:hypothetical protein